VSISMTCAEFVVLAAECSGSQCAKSENEPDTRYSWRKTRGSWRLRKCSSVEYRGAPLAAPSCNQTSARS